MAEPGDPHSPDEPARTAPAVDPHAHDDLIGFTSSASLGGRNRPPVGAGSEAPVEPTPPVQPAFDFDTLARKARPLGHTTSAQEPEARPAEAQVEAPQAAAAPSPIPSWAMHTPAPATRPARDFGRAPDAAVEGAMGLYTVYALILFAVPTLGVSALIALLAIRGRPLPDQPIARSHVLFQKRTLWIAAIGAVLGAVLIAVNLGVFVLFIMAVWVILRGAWGAMTLAAGRTIADPNHWLISRSY